jgi:hypothetical protein
MSPRRLAIVAFLFTWTLTTHGKYSNSGDEPHYLMITHSLVTDGDIDLANNYADDAGRLFGHGGLERGLHALPSQTGRLISIHGQGLAVFLVPAYAVARQIAQRTSEPLLRRFRQDRGLFTYSIVGLFLIGMTAAGMALTARGLDAVANQQRAALLVLLAAVSPPVVSHAFLVFPEVLALAATSVVVWFALKTAEPRDAARLPAVALMLGALPWTHQKFLLYVPGLVFVIVCRRWALIRRLHAAHATAAAALLLLPQLGLLAWTVREWGTLGGALTTEGVPFTLETFKAGAAGLWIDRQQGLLAYAPIYWVLPVCIALTWRQSWPFLVPVALLYVPAAAFVIGWWAGFAPAARYLVPAIPLLLVPMAAALRHAPVRWTLAVLAVPQLLLDATVWQRPRTLWPAAGGNPALDLLGAPGRLYAQMLPAIQQDGVAMPTVWVMVGGALGSAVLIWASLRKPAAS